jgi:hypothetical protein
MLTMKVLNRNQDFPPGCPMQGLRAVIPSLLDAPRARRDHLGLTHAGNSGAMQATVPLSISLSGGDTILVGEHRS